MTRKADRVRYTVPVIRALWQQNSYDSKDRGSVILAFLDAGGQPLAPDLESLRRTPGSWSLRELRAAVPPLTRTIRVNLKLGTLDTSLNRGARGQDACVLFFLMLQSPDSQATGSGDAGGGRPWRAASLVLYLRAPLTIPPSCSSPAR